LSAALTPLAAREAVNSAFDQVRTELEKLVRIPSVSTAGFDPDHVRVSAEHTAGWLERSGFDGVRLLEAGNAHPAVFGIKQGPPNSPTVLLYAHHDVQPPGDRALWQSPPFQPTERDGRLFGRGTSDDKAGIAVHTAALLAWNGEPPVTVIAFIEGEEETGSVHIPDFLSRYDDLLKADVVVFADCANWAIGRPSVITSIRGIMDCVVEVRTLQGAVHSGMFGGPVPDALTTLCQLIATLHDREGNVAVDGLRISSPTGLTISEPEFRKSVGIRPGVRLVGQDSLSHRLWTKPAITVLGIDSPAADDSAHNLVPVARAKISVRLAPGDDPQSAYNAVAEHLRDHVQWDAEIKIEPRVTGAPHQIDTSGGAYDAFRRACKQTWGCEPVEVGTGGSLPPVAALADTYPDMALLLTGVEDPESNAHGENESVHLDELRQCCVNEALLLGELAKLA
jgi:acetylornithine deacetylase/succinyl-diaminopimelate desuccinylase-like protein